MASTSDGSRQFFAIPGAADSAAGCDHAAVRGLGSDGGMNRYFECPDCGSVLVREGNFSYGDGTNDDLGTVDPRLEDLLVDIEAHHDGRRSPYVDTPETLYDRIARGIRRLLP